LRSSALVLIRRESQLFPIGEANPPATKRAAAEIFFDLPRPVVINPLHIY
jgi:hypothetical protein